MKRCPQCGAEYDNHVEYCFVDGTELSALSTSAATPLIPPPAIPPQRSRLLPLILIGVLLVVATPLVVGGVYFAMGPRPMGTDAPEDAPLVADPMPSGPTEDEPESEVRLVRIDSVPTGAEVWEEQTQLCSSTPCVVEQPDHAPSERTFLLKMAGYAPTSARLTKADPSLQVALLPVRRPGTRRADLPAPELPVPVEDPEPAADVAPLIEER